MQIAYICLATSQTGSLEREGGQCWPTSGSPVAVCSGIWCHAGTSQPGTKFPNGIEGKNKTKQNTSGQEGTIDSIPGVAGGTGTGEPQRPPKGGGDGGGRRLAWRNQSSGRFCTHTHTPQPSRVCALTNLIHSVISSHSQELAKPLGSPPYPTPAWQRPPGFLLLRLLPDIKAAAVGSRAGDKCQPGEQRLPGGPGNSGLRVPLSRSASPAAAVPL